MTITIVPENRPDENALFRAMAGQQTATGATVGAALDAIAAQIGSGVGEGDPSGTMVLVQRFQPDCFFTQAQQQRLQELMGRWHVARDAGGTLSPHEEAELNALVQAELIGATDRAQALLHWVNK